MSEYMSLSTSLNGYIIEQPTNHIRWLVKKDGTKILQQLYEISEYNKNKNRYSSEWRDVEEVSEEENKE